MRQEAHAAGILPHPAWLLGGTEAARVGEGDEVVMLTVLSDTGTRHYAPDYGHSLCGSFIAVAHFLEFREFTATYCPDWQRIYADEVEGVGGKEVNCLNCLKVMRRLDALTPEKRTAQLKRLIERQRSRYSPHGEYRR